MCIGASICTLLLELDNWLEILFDCLAAIFLTFSILILCFSDYKRLKTKLIYKIDDTKYGNKLRNDIDFRTMFLLVLSFCINYGYAIFELIVGIIYKSYWNISLSIYNLVLALIRTYLFVKNKKLIKYNSNEYILEQNKMYRNVGCFLLVLDFLMCINITQLFFIEQEKSINMILIIASATFIMYIFVVSIINFIKALKKDNKFLKALRNINMTYTLMALINLEITMINYFGDNNLVILEALTSFGACLISIILAITMIIKGQKNKKNDSK